MRTIFTISLAILLIPVGSFAQQQPQHQPQPRFQTRLQNIVRKDEATATKNYQLELTMQRGEKSARYKITLNSGSVSTELIDRLAERVEGSAPLTVNFNASLTPFDEGGGGEVAVSLGRSVAFKSKAQIPGGPPGTEREVISFKPIPLTTKVVLSPGKAVVIFEDEADKISLKLTELENEPEKP
jgi:hypothetical protein